MIDTPEDFQANLEELSSAEDFLDLLGVPYDRAVVEVNRLHILQRFHDYLEKISTENKKFYQYKDCLTRAYSDFVHSNAIEQKSLRVLQTREPDFVSLEEFL